MHTYSSEVYIHLGYKHLFLNHSTNFLLTNYSFGKSVRTFSLCMTQVIFQTDNCLQTDYFTYNSLYHNSSVSEVYIRSVDCVFKQLGKFQKRMSWL